MERSNYVKKTSPLEIKIMLFTCILQTGKRENKKISLALKKFCGEVWTISQNLTISFFKSSNRNSVLMKSLRGKEKMGGNRERKKNVLNIYPKS